ncbi:MAG: hypothetical protein DRP51_04645, partial [Candidatus Zixiibacteriota bacterium]
MYKGKIISIERSKGYGFIQSEVYDKLFFHQRWLRKVKFRDLEVGSEVTFGVNQGPRGPRAFNICLAGQNENAVKARPIE